MLYFYLKMRLVARLCPDPLEEFTVLLRNRLQLLQRFTPEQDSTLYMDAGFTLRPL